jgi:hypothetical protein
MFDSDRYDEDGNYYEDGYKPSSMFGPKMGAWTIRSIKDPRWNNNGRADGLVCEGGPKEMKDWVKSCKEKYGESPEDLMWSFWKD